MKSEFGQLLDRFQEYITRQENENSNERVSLEGEISRLNQCIEELRSQKDN